MEYKIGDRVEARVDTDGEWFPATVRGFGVNLGDIFIQFDSGGFDWWPEGGSNWKEYIRPLPTPPPPFKVGDEVEVQINGKWYRTQITKWKDVTGIYEIEHKRVQFGESLWASGLTASPSSINFRIRPCTPPKLVPLEAGDVPPGTVMKSSDGDECWYAVTEVLAGAIEVMGCTMRYAQLMDAQWYYSTPTDRTADGKIIWKPCSKEEVRDA
jgi:hypothetical protein